MSKISPQLKNLTDAVNDTIAKNKKLHKKTTTNLSNKMDDLATGITNAHVAIVDAKNKTMATKNNAELAKKYAEENKSALKWGGSVMNAMNLVTSGMDTVANSTFAALSAIESGDEKAAAGFITSAAGGAMPAIGGAVSGIAALLKGGAAVADLAGPIGVALGSFVSLIGLIVSGVGGLHGDKESIVDQVEDKLRHMDARDRMYHARALESMFNAVLHEFLLIDDGSLTMTDLLVRCPMNRGNEVMEFLVIEEWLLNPKNHSKLEDWSEVAEAYSMSVQVRTLLMVCAVAKLQQKYQYEQLGNAERFFERTKEKIAQLNSIYQNSGNYFCSGGYNNDRTYHRSQVLNGSWSSDNWSQTAGRGTRAFYVSPSQRRLWTLQMDSSLYYAGVDPGTNTEFQLVMFLRGKCELMTGLGEDRLLVKADNKLYLLRYVANDQRVLSITGLAPLLDASNVTMIHSNSTGLVAVLQGLKLFLCQVQDKLPSFDDVATWSNGETVSDNRGKWEVIDMSAYSKGIKGLFVSDSAIFVQNGVSGNQGYMNMLPLPPYKGVSPVADTRITLKDSKPLPTYKYFTVSRDNTLLLGSGSENSLHYVKLDAVYPFTELSRGNLTGTGSLLYKAPAAGAELALKNYVLLDQAIKNKATVEEMIFEKRKEEKIEEEKARLQNEAAGHKLELSKQSKKLKDVAAALVVVANEEKKKHPNKAKTLEDIAAEVSAEAKKIDDI